MTEPYVIPRRNVQTTDEVLVANGNALTIRRAVEDGQPAGATLYGGGWRIGEYKTEDGLTRRAQRELSAQHLDHHPRQPVRWWFASPPTRFQTVAVITEAGLGTSAKNGAAAGEYHGTTRIDGVTVHRFSGGNVGSVPMAGAWYLPADQRDVAEESHIYDA